MKLDENHTIQTDSSNYILTYEELGEVNEKTGRPIVHKAEYYYKNLADTLLGYMRKAIKPAKSVQEAVELMDAAEMRVMDAVKGLKLKQ